MTKLSNKTKRRLYTAAIVVLSVVLAVCIGLLIWYGIQSRQSEKLYTDLQSVVDQARATLPSTTAPAPTRPTQPTQPIQSGTQPTQPEATLPPQTTEPTPTEPVSPWVEVTDPETGETVLVLPEYAQLYQMNNDLIGWLEIDGSDIRYPVMQTPDSPDFYLRHDFNREYSIGGCLYAEEAADVFAPSDNVTIYGHRMSDDSMFNQLLRYQQEEYWRQYPYIRFDTLTERHVYEIVFAFKTTATLGEGLAYHNFVDAYHEYHFYEFIDQCRDLTIYNSSAKLTYGDKLITLSTCEYTRQNGRFVIIAKRIS